jgi:hypothetical protein
MSDLLLLVASPAGLPAAKADADPVWPSTPDGATLWAQHLHDELTAQPRLSSAAVGEVASWLRTQAVGRQTIVVSEPRVAKFAGVWAAAAVAAGVGETRLVSPEKGGEDALVEAIEPMVGSSSRPRLSDRCHAVGARAWTGLGCGCSIVRRTRRGSRCAQSSADGVDRRPR